MNDQKVARAYAQSITELADAEKVDIAKELTEFNVLINKNNNFETLLFLDVFTVEEKMSVIEEIFKKMSVSTILKSFVKFLIQEKRIGILPVIFKEVIVIDDHKKGFLRGVIEGREDDISPEFKKKIMNYLKEKVGINAEVTYVKNEKITAGLRVTVEDLQLDATLDNQLYKLKESVLERT